MAPPRRGPAHPSSQLTNAEFTALVLLLGAGIIVTALFISWAYHQRDLLLAPAGPARTAPEADPDYSPPAFDPDAFNG